LRILHVVAGAPTGGAETFSADAILALAERGVVQHVICRPHPIPLQRFGAAGIPVTPLSFSPLTRFAGAPARIRRIARAFEADAVHAWMGRAAWFVPARMPCPVIGWLGGYYDLKYYRTATDYIAITPDMRRSLIDRGAPADRVFLCHTFGTLPDSPPVTRAQISTPADALVLLVLSRMHQKKGIDTALKAMRSLDGAVLWLAGDGPELTRYQTLAAELGVAAKVRFLGWRTDRKSLLEACDICLLPSRYEPFGTVIAEAWSMRKPLIATPADGARQFVRDGDNGLIMPFDDDAALAAHIRAIAGSPALATRLGGNGYETYKRLFSRDIVTARLRDIYATVIAAASRPA
jgi:glycosyltransferase involved in cell wall biosynthesis